MANLVRQENDNVNDNQAPRKINVDANDNVNLLRDANPPEVVNVSVNVNVKKSTCMYQARCIHVLFLVQGCNFRLDL